MLCEFQMLNIKMLLCYCDCDRIKVERSDTHV